jgi:hypothetical protein|tara:strand:+ start:1141 stop:1263 length:123 start_codon:yes stop_codon:yes gene_type:complete
MKKSKYEYLLWNAYHTVIVILLGGLLVVEIMEYIKFGVCI